MEDQDHSLRVAEKEEIEDCGTVFKVLKHDEDRTRRIIGSGEKKREENGETGRG